MDVVVWLRSLGLGKYEATFREVEINCDIAHAKGGREILDCLYVMSSRRSAACLCLK
jgi:hypothetical protein